MIQRINGKISTNPSHQPHTFRGLSGCFKLNGSSQYAASTLLENSPVDFDWTDSYTICVNFSPEYVLTSDNASGIISKCNGFSPGALGWSITLVHGSNSAQGFRLGLEILNNPSGSLSNWTSFFTTNFFRYNRPYSFVIVKNGTDRANFKIFVNGIQQPVTLFGATTVTGSTKSNSFLQIGRIFSNQSHSYYYKGGVGKARIYNRALTEAEALNESRSESSNVAFAGVVYDPFFAHKNGKSVLNPGNPSLNLELIGYSDAETANAGQPQSGNTTWVYPYSLQPITT